MFRRWKCVLRQMLFICGSILACLSNMTPRFRHEEHGLILEFPIVSCLLKLNDDREEEITRNSVLSSLIFNLLQIIQERISLMHDSIEAMVSSQESTSDSQYSCVSSMYMWYCMLCLRRIAPRGMVYVQKIMGPRTYPCGTPNISSDRFDRILLMEIHWEWPWRYDSRQTIGTGLEIQPYLWEFL